MKEPPGALWSHVDVDAKRLTVFFESVMWIARPSVRPLRTPRIPQQTDDSDVHGNDHYEL